jgi:hypothetical protein
MVESIDKCFASLHISLVGISNNALTDLRIDVEKSANCKSDELASVG